MNVGNAEEEGTKTGGKERQERVQDDDDSVTPGGQALHQVEVPGMPAGPNLLVEEKARIFIAGAQKGLVRRFTGRLMPQGSCPSPSREKAPHVEEDLARISEDHLDSSRPILS